MTASSPGPDLAALFLAHRDAMYRVAARMLRDAGLERMADEAVQSAMVSLIANPPRSVENWQALMVATARRRALDILGTAAVKHAGPDLSHVAESADPDDLAEAVADAVDRERRAILVRDAVSKLGARHRKVIWEYKALDRPRGDIARQLGVSPGRVSQMAREALEMVEKLLRGEGVDS